MKDIVRRHHISFKNAFAGLFWSLQTQPNFRIHLVLSILAIWLGAYLGISRLEMIVIIFTIVLGMSVEMINTAIEAMTDLITTQWREEAKIAKDVAAGMMLTVALGAVIIAAVIFLPYLQLKFFPKA